MYHLYHHISVCLRMACPFLILLAAGLGVTGRVRCQAKETALQLEKLFQAPPPAASPWVIWYWNQASVSREGITADLEAMHQNGIAGAYLMFIKGAANPPLLEPVVVQLSPLWWQLVRHAMVEAKRLGLQIGIHYSDGFALGGGPWISPELSMQKLTWSTTHIRGGRLYDDTLRRPSSNENYYRDVAVFAYPSPAGAGISTNTIKPRITSSKIGDSSLQLLAHPGNKRNFTSEENCWIQYEFDEPFTVRSMVIHSRANYQSNRLLVEVSNDGRVFTPHTRLESPRHGWQDWDADHTHAIPTVTAKYFRFVFDKNGSEPGAEDLDAAKWKPVLRIAGIELSAESRIDQYEGKNGETWRISSNQSEEKPATQEFIPLNKLVDLTAKLDKHGRLTWQVPPGNWTVLRMGHTSTGHKNETAGGGKGLECDKFNPVAIELQFRNWFGAFFDSIPADVTQPVLTTFHLDSWECGSQNWSPVFREAFRRRRGYDLFPYLLAMAGVPLESLPVSEKFLLDVRTTIAELVNDNFYGTLSGLAAKKGCSFTAESVAPTMVSDGMLHYQHVTVPMGEFWLRSPTHDKPNDMLDAISAAHIYGKPIIQAEAFTELRLLWDEHPGMLKTLQDRNYALGINKLAYHVFMQNPWSDRKPGMTLDGIGLYFQRDQTWWKPGKAWVDYARRCQALLQVGQPVTDIAVFTGEELPRRSVLPDRLVKTLPGIFGKERVAAEQKRLLNEGQPMIQSPPGVNHGANMTAAEDWIDPLNGYAYDSYNKDALIRLSKVEGNRIRLAGGASYGLLVLPGKSRMNPAGNNLLAEVLLQLKALAEQGATLLFEEKPGYSPSIKSNAAKDQLFKEIAESFWVSGKNNGPSLVTGKPIRRKFGKGWIIQGAYTQASFEAIGISPDLVSRDQNGERSGGIAWTHRAAPGTDIYFISNQQDSARLIELSLRVSGRVPELWNAVTGEISLAKTWRINNSRTVLPISLPANGSLFVVLRQKTKLLSVGQGKSVPKPTAVQAIKTPWMMSFDSTVGGYSKPLVFDSLLDWSTHPMAAVKYFSGTAQYQNEFQWNGKLKTGESAWLNLGSVSNLAEIFINGTSCGIAWTAPFKVNISKALRSGKNDLRIAVTNTWANRIAGDQLLPLEKRITRTNAPYRLKEGVLLKAGLLGPVLLEILPE